MKKKQFVILPLLILLAALSLAVYGCSYITGEALKGSTQAPVQKELIRDVSPAEAYAMIAANAGHANFTIIDVRTAEEYAAGHIQGAINRDIYSPTFKDDINKFDKNNIYVVYCRTDPRRCRPRYYERTRISASLQHQRGYSGLDSAGLSGGQIASQPVRATIDLTYLRCYHTFRDNRHVCTD